MCVAVPGKLIEITGETGRVSIRGNVLPVALGIVKAQVGDYVLVHAGCAISAISQNEAEELEELFRMVEDYGKQA